ncbi:hypothetical protein N7L95_13285 [Eleftheria terrae]|nr:hypothetical protein [Eleftheria terrae]WKB50789.1 hypothetical protein N7L95_13285 [Eleftheria terrae]
MPLTVGVGHDPRCAIVSSEGRTAALADRLRFVPLRCAVGVGSDQPEAVAPVRRPDIGSSQHRPPAVIPERGQVTEDASESPSTERWAVLHEDVARSNLAHDARHLGPEAGALAVDAGAPAGDADILAGKAARYHVNTASPSASVKGAHVIPNRESREKAIVLAGDENACGVGVELDGANGAPSKLVAAE